MDVSHCSTASHLPCGEGATKLTLCLILERPFRQKCHRVDHMGVVYSARSSSSYSYISKAGFGTLEQQWVSLLVAQHHIPLPEKVPEKWNFAWNLRLVGSRNDTWWTMRGSCMLSEDLPSIFIHVRKVMKHFINNRYLSLWHSSTFPVLRGCSKSQICMKFDVCYWQKWHVVYHKRLM